jgi:hypothetical protein
MEVQFFKDWLQAQKRKSFQEITIKLSLLDLDKVQQQIYSYQYDFEKMAERYFGDKPWS